MLSSTLLRAENIEKYEIDIWNVILKYEYEVHMYNASNMTKLRNFKKAFSTKVIKLSKTFKYPYKIGEL